MCRTTLRVRIKSFSQERIRRELVTVDESAKTFAIKTASEGEVKFSYTDKTVITGAEKIVSGLAGVGTEVTVTYDSHGTAKVATQIEVRPKK